MCTIFHATLPSGQYVYLYDVAVFFYITVGTFFLVPCYTLGTTKEFFSMVLLKTKRYVFPVILLVLVVGVFLFFSPAQVVRDPSVSEESLVQSSLPSRAPEGYAVPARPVVTFPFTHVSADRLRLGNIQEVSEGNRPVLVTFANYPDTPQGRRSPDGQWALFYKQGVLSVVRTDGSSERRVLFTDSNDAINGKTSIPTIGLYQILWSWDSSRVFYKVGRQYYLDVERLDNEYEQWIESVNIETGEVTRHPDIGFSDNLHSHATARYPTDPVIFDDSSDYRPEGPRGIKTHDGSVSWVIDDLGPLYLSPNKQLVLGYGRNDRTQRYYIYTTDGSKLYSFDNEVPASRYLWSPDSSKFAYHHGERDGHTDEPIFSELYIMNLDGTSKTQLTDTPEVHEHPQGWTADGQLVFTVKDRWYVADLVTE